jgi:phospholipid/cholesterol/gamma-HCH transport system substrate-binding protein
VRDTGRVLGALGRRQGELSGLVTSGDRVLSTTAARNRELAEAVRILPTTLAELQLTLDDLRGLAVDAAPVVSELRPAARALGPSLRQTRPFLRRSTPVIKNEIRPFTRAALPTVKQLRPAMRDLAAATPDLTASFKVVNRLLNEIAYNPPGKQDEGFLFWQAWVNHAGDSLFSSQDAHGPIRRGLIVLSCQTAQVLDSVTSANPQLATLIGLLGAPTTQQICPASTQSPVGGG